MQQREHTHIQLKNTNNNTQHKQLHHHSQSHFTFLTNPNQSISLTSEYIHSIIHSSSK
jgi:hypothetical protein